LLQNKWKELADKYCDEKGVNILMTHLFVMKKGGEKPEEYEDEKTVLMVGGAQEIYSENFPKNLQYVALGHIHRPQVIDKQHYPVVYSGSPLAYSMAEAGQEKSIILLEVEPNQAPQYQKIALTAGKKLVRKSFDDIEKAAIWLKENPHTIVELTIVTDTYLTALQRKQLYDAHSHIFIHLHVNRKENDAQGQAKQLDLTRNIEEVFMEYFQQKHQKVPNSQIMDIFKEILAED
jgi:exonuclease SbcD